MANGRSEAWAWYDDQAEVEWWSRSPSLVLTFSLPTTAAKSAQAASRLALPRSCRIGRACESGAVEFGSGSLGLRVPM